ncbi:MAG: SMP-30/gluconolactonase/LRE family protein [Gammaproteobacteria bacterium]|nr:SMP-30/gluconolactonase/LRE family protein [Gammaproteobacteria bacterium]
MMQKLPVAWLIGFAMLALSACDGGSGGDEDPVLRPEPGGTEEEDAEGAAGAAAAAQAPEQEAGSCEPDGELEYVCGPVNAEDIVQLGDSRWLIVSGMSVAGQGESAPGRLYLVDHERRTHEEWFPAEDPVMRADTQTFAACPGPLDTRNFSAHGLALGEQADGRYRLYITSHGAREAIEVFDVDASADRPSIAWIGCVVLPERTFANSVAILSDGGFVTTKMMDPTAQNGFADIMAGEITGNVYEWHPGGEVEAVEGTEMSGANGIELSPDDRYMYVAAFGSREILRFDREADPIESRSVEIDIRADNLRWSDEGTLYTVGGNYVSPDECQGPQCATGWSVIEIDPQTLEASRVAGVDQDAALQGASTALPVGDEIWVGTFSGDRVGYLPKP